MLSLPRLTWKLASSCGSRVWQGYLKYYILSKSVSISKFSLFIFFPRKPHSFIPPSQSIAEFWGLKQTDSSLRWVVLRYQVAGWFQPRTLTVCHWKWLWKHQWIGKSYCFIVTGYVEKKNRGYNVPGRKRSTEKKDSRLPATGSKVASLHRKDI